MTNKNALLTKETRVHYDGSVFITQPGRNLRHNIFLILLQLLPDNYYID